MKIDIEIKGLDKLDKKLNELCKRLPETIKSSIDDIAKNIQGYAVRLEKGQNDEGILCEMIDMSKNEVVERIYADPSKFMADNNQSYLWFEYFGTGQWAEQEHIGKTKHFIESRLYRMVYTSKQSKQNTKLSNYNDRKSRFLCCSRFKRKSFFGRCRV